ncbi:MAG: flagellar basal body L-ring protein FlgH [Sphingomonas sp.]|nr:flagellar basal body L-ring protein FlgH [Sphingomonas sp.]
MIAPLLLLLAAGDDLYRAGNWPAMAADRRASAPGDVLTIVIFQAAESSNTMQNASRRATEANGGLRAGGVNEQGLLTFGGGYSGRGELRRAERFVTQLSVQVEQVLPNGDLIVVGRQRMNVNGENTLIGVRGRIRTADIASDNSVLSTRIADAEIDYNGKGFVSRSAKPGLINRLFNWLGLN